MRYPDHRGQDYVIQPSDVGSWAIPNLQGGRISIASVAGVGLVAQSHVGRRVYRLGGAVHLESRIDFQARQTRERILSLGL